MSRLGKKPIEIPEGTDVAVSGRTVSVKGPKGTLERTFKPQVDVSVKDGAVHLKAKGASNFHKALWGTYASHIMNMIKGVNDGYEKRLVIQGIGYRANVSGTTLELNVGYSHTVQLDIPEDLDVSVEGDEIIVKGIDKEKVGQFAAEVRGTRPPEPYKGKGIRYVDEVIRRKEGKKTVA